MMGIEEIGLVVVVWGVSAIIFRDWVVKFDLAMRERVTGDFFTEEHIDEQRRLLDRTARIVLVLGLLVFLAGAALRFARIA
jgi:hypothetical protein